jgi:hypothetical protein
LNLFFNTRIIKHNMYILCEREIKAHPVRVKEIFMLPGYIFLTKIFIS